MSHRQADVQANNEREAQTTLSEFNSIPWKDVKVYLLRKWEAMCLQALHSHLYVEGPTSYTGQQ